MRALAALVDQLDGLRGGQPITPERAFLDADSKTLTTDLAEAPGVSGYGVILERPATEIDELFEEHARVRLSPDEPPLELGTSSRLCLVMPSEPQASRARSSPNAEDDRSAGGGSKREGLSAERSGRERLTSGA